MIKLGLSAFYHDSAAALLYDGKVIFAIEEEKLSGIKHDNSFPFKAIQKCLDYAQITIDEIDMVCWYENPDLKYNRVQTTLGNHWITHCKTWNQFKKNWKKNEGNLKSILNGLGYDGPIINVKHHLSHLALSFYTSPFDDAIGLSVDGVGVRVLVGVIVGVATILALGVGVGVIKQLEQFALTARIWSR
jgi:carbamoyltransferase